MNCRELQVSVVLPPLPEGEGWGEGQAVRVNFAEPLILSLFRKGREGAFFSIGG